MEPFATLALLPGQSGLRQMAFSPPGFLPGFGSLLVDSLQLLDVPLIEACVLIAAAIYIAANLLADMGAILFNPRLRPA